MFTQSFLPFLSFLNLWSLLATHIVYIACWACCYMYTVKEWPPEIGTLSEESLTSRVDQVLDRMPELEHKLDELEPTSKNTGKIY